ESNQQDRMRPQNGLTRTFGDLAPGRYAIGVIRGWNGPLVAHDVVEVVDHLVERELEVPPLDPNACLVVRVRGMWGGPLANVTFQMSEESDRGSNSQNPWSTRRGNGSYWLLPPANFSTGFDKKWPDGAKVFVEAQTREFGNKRVQVFESQHN